MENDLQVKYDSICYITFKNIAHLTKNVDRIVLKHFDWHNGEHKFVLSIINACYGLLDNKDVAIDAGPMTRSIIAKSYPNFGKIKKVTKADEIFVDVPELLDKMRDYACDLCGDLFSFWDIYDEYYSGTDR